MSELSRWKVVVLGAFCLVVLVGVSNLKALRLKNTISKPPHEDFYQVELTKEEEYLISLSKGAAVEKSEVSRDTKGLIVPHHLLAGEDINRAFSYVGAIEDKTIVLIGPDHKNLTSSDVLIGKKGWQSEFGFFGSNRLIVNSLMDSKLVKISDSVEHEHSLYGLLPLLVQNFAGNQIVTMMIGPYVLQETIEELVDEVSLACENNCLLIGSVDFVHGGDVVTGKQNDIESFKKIHDGDYGWLYRQDNSYFDSPQVLHLLAGYAQKQGLAANLFSRSDSTEKLMDATAELTSYQVVMFE